MTAVYTSAGIQISAELMLIRSIFGVYCATENWRKDLAIRRSSVAHTRHMDTPYNRSESFDQREDDIVDTSLTTFPVVEHRRTTLESNLLVELPPSGVPPHHVEVYPGRPLTFDSIEQSLNQSRTPTPSLILFKDINVHVCGVFLQYFGSCEQRAALAVVDRTPK